MQQIIKFYSVFYDKTIFVNLILCLQVHARIQKVLSKGSNFDVVFLVDVFFVCFFVDIFLFVFF